MLIKSCLGMLIMICFKLWNDHRAQNKLMFLSIYLPDQVQGVNISISCIQNHNFELHYFKVLYAFFVILWVKFKDSIMGKCPKVNRTIGYFQLFATSWSPYSLEYIIPNLVNYLKSSCTVAKNYKDERIWYVNQLNFMAILLHSENWNVIVLLRYLWSSYHHEKLVCVLALRHLSTSGFMHLAATYISGAPEPFTKIPISIWEYLRAKVLMKLFMFSTKQL